MKVTFEGRVRELDVEHIRLQQAMTIQLYTGLSIADWEDSLGLQPRRDEQGSVITDKDGNPEMENPGAGYLKSLAALYWLMLAQNGEQAPIADVDFDIGEFMVAVMTAVAAEVRQRKAEAEAAAAARPTSPPLTSPAPASQASPTPMTTTLPPPVPPEPPTAY